MGEAEGLRPGGASAERQVVSTVIAWARRAATVVVCVGPWALPTGLAAQSLDESIRSEVARYVRALNAGDADAIAGLLADQEEAAAVADGAITRGRHGLTDLLGTVSREARTVEMAVDSVTVIGLGADAAVAFFPYRLRRGGRNEATIEQGAMTVVFARAGRRWTIVHRHASTHRMADAASLEMLSDSGPRRPVRPTMPCVPTHIVDGDTIECRDVGRVRLIGMDTPERSQAPYGAQATAALAAMVQVGDTIELERDTELRDRYDRLLAHVWADGVLVNWALVRLGWAVLLTYPPNVQYVDALVEAERLAREQGLGLWSVGGFTCLPADRRRGRCD